MGRVAGVFGGADGAPLTPDASVSSKSGSLRRRRPAGCAGLVAHRVRDYAGNRNKKTNESRIRPSRTLIEDEGGESRRCRVVEPPASRADRALEAAAIAGPLARPPLRRSAAAACCCRASAICSGSALGLYPVLLAWQRRAPKALVARMLLNLAADAAGGAIPILGDVWDFLFRAHARNLAAAPPAPRSGVVRGTGARRPRRRRRAGS